MSTIKELPTSDLLTEALKLSHKDAESERRWGYVRELHVRGEPGTFEAARSWCGSNDVVERELAADILAQLGSLAQEGQEQLRPFTRQTIPLLKGLLDDPEARVVASSVYALGHHYVRDPIAKKASLASHASVWVRQAVAVALGGATSPPEIQTLIKLSMDETDDVRDWATFGLGSRCRLDTPEIRQALFRRISDSHTDTRHEALLGLASRGDARVVPFLKSELEADGVFTLCVEAAGEIASGELVESLEALVDWWDVDTELLHAALKRCRGEPCPERGWENAAEPKA